MTKNAYHWNSGIKGSGEMNDKWMKEFVLFGMIVVPVYKFTALMDALSQLNPILEWGRSNQIVRTGE